MSLKGTSLYQSSKAKKSAGLNLVSLMDIFTILVFFLLMNSGDSQEIESAKFVRLPDSQASSSFTNELLVTIGKYSIMIDDKEIVDVDRVTELDGKPVPEIIAALQNNSLEKGMLTEFEKKNGRSVTILGDKVIPYGILRSVMASCSQENYRDIALAVNQVVTGAVSATGSATPVNVGEQN